MTWFVMFCLARTYRSSCGSARTGVNPLSDHTMAYAGAAARRSRSAGGDSYFQLFIALINLFSVCMPP